MKINLDIATALGIPLNAREATLYLKAGEPPRLEVTMLVLRPNLPPAPIVQTFEWRPKE